MSYGHFDEVVREARINDSAAMAEEGADGCSDGRGWRTPKRLESQDFIPWMPKSMKWRDALGVMVWHGHSLNSLIRWQRTRSLLAKLCKKPDPVSWTSQPTDWMQAHRLAQTLFTELWKCAVLIPDIPFLNDVINTSIYMWKNQPVNLTGDYYHYKSMSKSQLGSGLWAPAKGCWF